MELDHSNAFATVTFDGLIGFCICRRDDYRCEMGLVPTDDHEPLLKIVRIGTNGVKTVIRDQRLGPNDNVTIEAVEPVTRGASTFETATWDPVGNLGDPEDFRWVMDLQSSRFHGEHLSLNRGTGGIRLRPRVTIPHGIFYTKRKTSIPFRRFRRPDREPRVPIGRIADKIGADLLCNFVAGQKTVKVTVGSEQPLLLEFKTTAGEGFIYKIRITNLCRQSGTPRCPANQSDVPRYYTVATDIDGIEYDLQPLYPRGDPRGKTPLPEFNAQNFPELQGFQSDGPPEVCSVAFFGRANSIP